MPSLLGRTVYDDIRMHWGTVFERWKSTEGNHNAVQSPDTSERNGRYLGRPLCALHGVGYNTGHVVESFLASYCQIASDCIMWMMSCAATGRVSKRHGGELDEDFQY
jgi:hypothetical protein